MFSMLRLQLKLRLKRFIYDLIKTRYEAQTWTRTMTCPSCDKNIAYDAHYCTYCGRPMIVHNVVQYPFPPSNTAFIGQDTEPMLIKPVSVVLPPYSLTRRFLTYVRHTKKKAGPDTLRHRLQQDLEYPPVLGQDPQARLKQRDTSKAHIIIP